MSADPERQAVKLLIFDPQDRLLLLRAADPASERWGWYPVGGGIEPGEGVEQAAQREAAEETGLPSTEPFAPPPDRAGSRSADLRAAAGADRAEPGSGEPGLVIMAYLSRFQPA